MNDQKLELNFRHCQLNFFFSTGSKLSYPMGAGSLISVLVKWQGEQLTTHLYLLLKLRIHGAMPTRSRTSSLHDASLNTGATFMFSLHVNE
jgi:hypothetical protein